MAAPLVSRTFDWLSRHDDRSRSYAVAPLIAVRQPRRRVLWTPPARPLDQGREGACVAHGWVHEALSSPVRVDFARVKVPQGWPSDPQALAFRLYDWCRRNDEWEGEEYDGTSVLAGAKGMKLLGLLKEYRWCFSTSDVIDALLGVGPVVLGIPWYDGMYEAPGGNLTVSGRIVGGHCILAVGYDPEHLFPDGTVGPAVALYNSWGPDWGVNGLAWISLPDLAKLLADQGEACVPLSRSYGRTRLTAALRALLARVRTAAHRA